jgi:RNA polymerase sigma-70 factor (ECF subfamily)
MRDPAELTTTIDEVLRGNRDAFRKIVRDHSLSLRSYIAAHVYRLDDVDDLAQDVLIEAFRNLGDFRREGDFGAWLRGIARNKIHTFLRSANRRNKALERFRDEVVRMLEGRLERTMDEDSGAVDVMLHCIGRLPERMQRVVRGGLDGDKPADLANQLLTTIAAVYRLHFRANQLLRKCMREEVG